MTLRPRPYPTDKPYPDRVTDAQGNVYEITGDCWAVYALTFDDPFPVIVDWRWGEIYTTEGVSVLMDSDGPMRLYDIDLTPVFPCTDKKTVREHGQKGNDERSMD